nr:14475_t:CDS:2 [Entrophospora candida]
MTINNNDNTSADFSGDGNRANDNNYRNSNYDAVTANEDEHTSLLNNLSRHSNNCGKNTDVLITIKDCCWSPRSRINPSSFRDWNVLSLRITLFPHTHHHLNSKVDEFGRYKYIGMVMFFISGEKIKNHIDLELDSKPEPEEFKIAFYTTISAYALSTVITVVHFLNTSQKSLIKDGWIFELQKNQTTIPEFYSDFKFKFIDWEAIGETIPTMLMLGYFTILNVNINISKLETSLDNHNQLNRDRELIVQGVSNLISGTFQVSLGHEESIILIKSGVNNHVMGMILAFCIGITVYFGEILLLIEHIPTIAVGTIIFYLGLEMIREALLDSWKIFNMVEYLNVIATMGAMVITGFVEGIYIGITISYISFMLSNYQKGVIKTTFLGNSDRSFVRRHYRDQRFLEEVGSQIYGMTLQGYMFYGAIKRVENTIKKALVDGEQDGKPIKFLILNMLCVTGFDINSVHVLESIQKHLQHQRVYLVICGYKSQEACVPLKNLSFWNDVTNDYVKFCDEVNEALEWFGVQHQTTSSLLNDESFCSPQIEDAGRSIFENKIGLESKNKLVNILMKAFKEITNEREEFFNLLVPYFTKEEIQKDSQLWSKGDNPNCIYVVEQGQLSTWISAENNIKKVTERILPLTMVGELGFFTDNQRQTNLVTDTLCVLWKMDQASYLSMMKCNPVLGAIFMKLAMKFSVERLRKLDRYVFD